MSDEPGAPISSEVRDFFARAESPSIDSGFEERLLGRLVQSSATVAPVAAAATSWVVKALLLGSGLALGVGADRLWIHLEASKQEAPPTQIVAVAPTETPRVVEAPVAPVVPVAPAPVQRRIPMVPAPVAEKPAEPARDLSLSAERTLVEIARSALAKNDAEAALQTLDRHEAEFPNGALVEEREFLRVRALLTLGRRSEAEQRAKAFLARFPESALGDALEAQLRQ